MPHLSCICGTATAGAGTDWGGVPGHLTSGSPWWVSWSELKPGVFPERVPAVPYLFDRCSRISEWIAFTYNVGAL